MNIDRLLLINKFAHVSSYMLMCSTGSSYYQAFRTV